jgi:putative N6-adenine-specific DNA methylase
MKLIAKTLYGLENVLAEELESLGAGEVQKSNRAVLFNGNKELLYKANYSLRTALTVLVQISEFRIKSKDDLYKKTLAINWSDLMDADSTFSVVPVINSKIFAHTGYPALVVKDAIADYFRKKTGSRPSVDSSDPSVMINLHVSNDSVSLSLDSSGVALFKRGYRIAPGTAPLNEVLAAGILLLSGWNATASLLDPMCGSGTFPIEAAMIACRIPPGRLRHFYSFSRWKDFDPELFRHIKRECDIGIRRSPVNITGSDISEEAVKQSIANIINAGLSDEISVNVSDIGSLKAQDKAGYVFINPPYGQRLKPEELDKLYGMIGSILKHKFAGNRVWIISSGKEYLKNIGLKPNSKRILFNGSLECILAEYVMYEGSEKRTGGDQKT